VSWQPIESLPEHTDALVCVTYNVPGEEDDSRPPAGDSYVWETVQWVDWYSKERGWFCYPRLVEIPFPPTHWRALPEPPTHNEAEG
jgi:hypothetical protein